MGLIDFIFNGNRKPSPTNQRLEPLVDEFVRLTTTVDGWNRGDARFTQQTFLHLAAVSDAHGSDAMLLNGPSPLRVVAIELSDQEARDAGSKESPEYFGLRFFNLWLRAQQEESDDAKEIFREICGLMFKARQVYYASLPDKSRFVIRKVTAVGLAETRQFQCLKNFMLLRELGRGSTSQHLVGSILGYADAYLNQLGVRTPQGEDYVPLITDGRLAKNSVIIGAYVRDGSVKPESMKLVDAGRIEGAELFLGTLKHILA